MDRVRATIESGVRFVVGGLAGLAVLGGCGSSTPRPNPAREAQLVAEANAVCDSFVHRPRPTQRSELEATNSRLAAIAKALSHAAAYLPAGRALNEARAKRRALLAEVRSTGPNTGFYRSGVKDPVGRLYRLQLQIYDDEKALGLAPCLGPPPRPPISG